MILLLNIRDLPILMIFFTQASVPDEIFETADQWLDAIWKSIMIPKEAIALCFLFIAQGTSEKPVPTLYSCVEGLLQIQTINLIERKCKKEFPTLWMFPKLQHLFRTKLNIIMKLNNEVKIY